MGFSQFEYIKNRDAKKQNKNRSSSTTGRSGVTASNLT